METIENTFVERFSNFASVLAKVSFFIFLFFTFFGTSLPFQSQIRDVGLITTSSPFNQFVFSSLYLLSLLSLLAKKDLLIEFIKKEKFLSLFLLWCFLSLFWSDYPFVSFKRLIRILGSGVVFLSVLLNFRSNEEAIQYFKIILLIYIPLTFLSISFIPAAIQWEFPAWRGLAPHKNSLGQISLVSLIIWSYVLSFDGLIKKITAYIFWVLSFVLLIGSKSTTSILAVSVLVSFLCLFYAEKRVFRPIVGNVISSSFVLLFCIGLIPIIYLGQDLLVSSLGILGKDPTFSGRTYLWSSIFEEAKMHLLYGCGYGGFWVVDSSKIGVLYEEYMWLPNESHLGYLDILNETGLVGIFLFILMVICYFINLSKLHTFHFWKWFVITALIVNLSESSLFIPNSLTGELFIFSYIALYVAVLKRANEFEPALDRP